jgi:hypothetical protein
MSGGRVYGQHGSRHGPRGSDPTNTDVWQFISGTVHTAWSSGTNYASGDLVSHGHFNWQAIRASGPATSVFEPEVDVGWFSYWSFYESFFINGENQTPFSGVPNPHPMAFRLSVGGPNYVDANGTIESYSRHQLEFAGDLKNIFAGEIVFYVPLEFRHEYDTPTENQHDDVGLYVPCRLLSTGEFIYGTV